MVGLAGGAEWQNILAAAQAMVQRHQGQLADEMKTSDRPSAQFPPQQQQQAPGQQQDANLAAGEAQQPAAGTAGHSHSVDATQSMAIVKQESPSQPAAPEPESAWLSEMVSGCVSMLLTMQRCAEQPVTGHAVNAALANSLKMLQPHAASNQPIFHKIEHMVTMLRDRLLQS